MTERAPSGMASEQHRSGGALLVAWASCAMFLTLLALFATRMATGADPALRARAAAPLAPRRVLVRRIYQRRVVVHLPPSAPPEAARSSSRVSSNGAFSPTQAVTRTS